MSANSSAMASSSKPAARALSTQLRSVRAQRIDSVGLKRRQRARDERALPPPAFGQALEVELAVGLEDGVGIDREAADHLLDGRELIAGMQDPEPHGLLDLLHELEIGGDARAGVQAKLDHFPSLTS